jgi:hypothetical protein
VTEKAKAIGLSAAVGTIGEFVVLLGTNRSGVFVVLGLGIMATVLFTAGIPKRSIVKVVSGTTVTVLVAAALLGSGIAVHKPCTEGTFSRECLPSFLPTTLSIVAAACALSVFPLALAITMASHRKAS